MSKYELKSSNPKDKLGIQRVPLHLNPTTAAVHQALAHLDGAIKYGAFNWREEGVSVSVYVSAALRHIHKYFEREKCARDSGVHHLGHAMACLAIVLDSEELGNLVDDRPPWILPTYDLESLHERGKRHIKRKLMESEEVEADPKDSVGRGDDRL